MVRRSLLALGLLVAPILVILGSIRAQAHAEVWKVTSDEWFPPYSFHKDGVRTGIDTEIVEAVLARMGVAYEHEALPWTRVIISLDRNLTTMAFQFVGTAQRRAAYHLVGPIRDGVTVFAVPRDSSIRDWDRLEDFAGRRVGVVQNFAYTDAFDTATYIIKDTASNNELNMRKLAAGRLDAIIGDLHTLRFVAKSQRLAGEIRYLPKALATVPRYVAFPKAREMEAGMFQDALDSLKAEGAIDAIITRWQRDE